MKEIMLWSLEALICCLTGWFCYRTLKNRRVSGKPVKDTPSEQQQAVALLRQHREDMALASYRKDCVKLFAGLSSGIQALLAQENGRSAHTDDFCAALADAAEEECLAYRIKTRKKRQAAAPVTPEESALDSKAIREIIRIEQLQAYTSALPVAWDILTDRLVPCLETLLTAVGDNRPEECRSLLVRLRQILADQDIYPIWYHEDTVQSTPAMQWDYTEGSGDPIPVLYYRGADRYVRIGAPGSTGDRTEKEISKT